MGIALEHDGGAVAELVLDRPERLNAFGHADLVHGLGLVRRAAADPSVRVLLVRGNGSAFCAGADRSFLEQILAMDAERRAVAIRPGVDLVLELVRFPALTVAVAQGACYGGGACLALACDTIVADESTRFGLIFTALGLPGGDMAAPWLLTRRVGGRQAWQLLANAAVVDARRAVDTGLVDELAPAGAALARGREVASALTAVPRDALADTKRQILELEGGFVDLDHQVVDQMEAIVRAFDGAEYAAASASMANRKSRAERDVR